MAKGRVHNIRFQAALRPLTPRCATCGADVRNNVVHAQHWIHDDGPHPTLCVIHGFLGSPYLFNGLFFSLPWFYRSGYDVLLYTLPFHGRRAEQFSLQRVRLFRQRDGRIGRSHGAGGLRLPLVLDYLEFTGVDRLP